jgi:hypothetical protein
MRAYSHGSNLLQYIDAPEAIPTTSLKLYRVRFSHFCGEVLTDNLKSRIFHGFRRQMSSILCYESQYFLGQLAKLESVCF